MIQRRLCQVDHIYQNKEPKVLVAFGTKKVALSEAAARQLADDLLREANYLWPLPAIQENEKL